MSLRKKFAAILTDAFELILAVDFGQRRANKGAAPALCFEEAKRFQFVVSFLHGERRNYDPLAQLSGARAAFRRPSISRRRWPRQSAA